MLDFQTILPYLKVDANGLPIDKRLFHAGYDKSVKMRNEIRAVFSEEYPERLNIDRPNEKPEHKKFRKDIYKNVVGRFRTKALSMPSTIRQNDDFNIVFNKDNPLKEYTENDIYENLDLTEWWFSKWAKFYVDDPNAVLAPVFTRFATTDQQYNKAELKLFSCEGVIQLNRDICVLRGDELTWIETSVGKKEKIGRNLYFFDKDSMLICKQTGLSVSNDNTSTYKWEIIGQGTLEYEGEDPLIIPLATNKDKIPAWRIGRILGEEIDGEVQLYRSEVSDALPYLWRILNMVSDTDIEFLLHIHTIEWQYVTENSCNAPGCEKGWITAPAIDGQAPKKTKCRQCKGTGLPQNGLGMIMLTIPKGGGIDPNKPVYPNPIAGYVERNIETVKTLQEGIKDNWASAMATLNMDWLNKVPLNESGTAKAKDREEHDKRLAEIALHIKKGLSLAYDWIGALQFGVSGDYRKLLPSVNVPTDSFNLTTQEEALEELTKLKGMKADGSVINSVMISYSAKKFGQKTDLTRYLVLKSKADPYPTLNLIEKNNLWLSTVKTFGTESTQLEIIKNDIFKSIHLDSIIKRILLVRPDLYDMEYSEQVKLIDKELINFLPSKISDQIYTTIKQEPLVDIEQNGQAALN